MNKRLGCTLLAVMFFLALLTLLAIGGFVYFRQRQAKALSQTSPPLVLINDPPAGSTFPAESFIVVSATAFGKTPLMRVELWLDGELLQSQQSSQPAGLNPFPASFSLLVPPGEHSLFIRAVNTLGVIGQSLPLGLIGTDKAAEGEILMTVNAKEGQTLADIANAYGADPAALQTLNPQLGGQEPTSGAIVTLPLAPEQEKNPPTPPSAAPQPAAPLPDVPMLTLLEPALLPVDLGVMVPISLPLPPTGLQGQVDNCQVTLSWNDNADNESRYEVWTAWQGITPQLIAELAPSPTKGPAWYRFRAPQTGWIPFWVEAVTAKGKQPSNEITLYIDPQKCEWSQGGGQYLTVQVFEMTVKDNSERVYCYVSYENNPEQRIPQSSEEFIDVKGGKANFSGLAVGAMISGPNSVLIPMPLDGALDVTGKCLGWAGSTIHELGSFAASFTSLEWDGARRTLKSQKFDLEFAIKPWTPAVEAAALGKYWYVDPTLPVPWGLSISGVRSPGFDVDPRERSLHWKWDGNPNLIKGFQVFLEGKPYGYFDGANIRSASVLTPYFCGHTVKWQVAAVSGAAQSQPSAIFEDILPNCKTYVTVKFKTIGLIDTKDGFKPWAQWQPCDSLDLYYSLGLNATKKKFGWSPSFGEGCVNCLQSIACGSYSFQSLGSFFNPSDPNPDTLVTVIETENIPIRLWADLWDYDWHSGDDRISYHLEEHQFPSLQKAQEELGCGKEFMSFAKITDSAGLSTLHYDLTVYPNACADFPLGIQLPVSP
ncbi:MAG: hypothetical protein ACOY16_02155 [Chloroflexota bacterium]